MKQPTNPSACGGWLLLILCLVSGCGTTKSRTATEQLLLSDAVDRSVASLDFRELSGEKVYFDTQYIRGVNLPGNTFVNANYIISSLRQQLFAAGVELHESINDAEYVVEARVGALGMDSHDVVYGVPASNALGAAASLMPNAPNVPVIPEIAVMKRVDQLGAAKLAVFAYHRESKQPVWQSGVAKAKSTSKDVWVLGAGPFERGTMWDGTHFAGSKLAIPMMNPGEGEQRPPLVEYDKEVHFLKRSQDENDSEPELEVVNFTDGADEVDEGDEAEEAGEPAQEMERLIPPDS